MNHPPRRLKTLSALAALLAASACAGAATMPPVRMKLVDAQDGGPVAGVHVLFQASAREGTFTGHGGRGVSLFAAEAVTDDAGELRLPKQEFAAQPFFLNTNYENPSMLLLKPGYALVILHNSRRAVPDLKEITVWEYNEQTIRMKRAAGAETSSALYLAATYANQAMADRALCGWKKFPRFLVALDRAAQRDKQVSSPLQVLLQNDQLFVDRGCGSPKAFFEPYLR